MKNRKRVDIYYLLMLATTIAHIFEEIWGTFWILEVIGFGWFLALNWLLFCIPLLIYYFILNEKRWAYKLGIVYSGFMGIQGIGHNLGILITGRYFGGFAGGITGIILIIFSIPLIYYLLKAIPQGKNKKRK